MSMTLISLRKQCVSWEAHVFESAGWAMELIEHPKGHMIPMEHHAALKEWLTALSQIRL